MKKKSLFWRIPLIIPLILVFTSSIFVNFVGCSHKTEKQKELERFEKRLSEFRKDNSGFIPFEPKEIFTIVEEPKPIANSPIGMVIVKRETDNFLFSAIINLNQKVVKGTMVKLIEINYRHSKGDMYMSLLMVIK